MGNPKLVIKVETETGDEILRTNVPMCLAGRFLGYLGNQLELLSGAVTLTKPVPPAKKAGEES